LLVLFIISAIFFIISVQGIPHSSRQGDCSVKIYTGQEIKKRKIVNSQFIKKRILKVCETTLLIIKTGV